MPDTVILTLEYLDLTLRDMSFKVAAARTTKREGVPMATWSWEVGIVQVRLRSLDGFRLE